MDDFQQALQHYRVALQAASLAATTDIEMRMYRLYSADLAHIERLYRNCGDPKWCLPILESGRILHQSDLLVGSEVRTLRGAFDRLLDICRHSLRDIQ